LASREDRFRHAPSARAARAGDDLVLLHLGRGTYYTLNETGAFLWGRLDSERTLQEIGAAMVERFEIDAETAWGDLSALVDELVAEGLIEPAPAPNESP